MKIKQGQQATIKVQIGSEQLEISGTVSVLSWKNRTVTIKQPSGGTSRVSFDDIVGW
jgi:hypothetical protein